MVSSVTVNENPNLLPSSGGSKAIVALKVFAFYDLLHIVLVRIFKLKLKLTS